MSVTIYHNPGCTKCRLSMQLLKEHDCQPEVIEYLKTPPDANSLVKILELLGMEPRDLMRKHEAEYLENNLADESLDRGVLIQAMIDYPNLIERPIVIADGRKAVIGRPPERILEIL